MTEPINSQSGLPGGAELLHYHIGGELGRGGFGITYKAEDAKLKRAVVIKEYLPQDIAGRRGDYGVAPHTDSLADNFQSGLDSFLKEAQTLAKFHHPNIVPVLDFFKANGTAYLVMPFLEGQTLADRLAKLPGGRMSEAEVMAWLNPLLDGLQTIHAAGFLHRDIKPDNIFLQTSGNPILIDFGAARNALANRSRSLSVVLTPGYAPAEQYTAAAANQGPWTDLYALGAVIFRCLTGAEPTDSTERQDTITNGEPAPLVPKLRNLAGVASPGLAKAVEGCLRVARKDRIQGVAELRQVLNNRLTPNPESIKPTPVREETETTPGHRSNGYAYVSSQDQNLEFQMSFPLATRWPRFFARIFDVWLEIMLVSIVLGVVLGYYSAGFIEWINDPGGSLFLGIICLPIGLMLDAAVYRLIGNTPGKALLGLKVSTLDGRALSFGQYLYRNFSIWIAGLAFGLPIIYLITMARQGQRLARGQQTSYDESTGYRVRAKQIGWIRRLGFGLVFTGLLLVMAVFNSMEKAAQREQILSSISPDYSWENPITRINAKIGSQWKNSTQQNDDGQPVYMFSERTGHAVIILALESVSGFTLNDYVQGFQKNTTAHMRFSDGGRFSEKNNSPVWQGSGRMVDTSGSRLNVQIMQVGSDFWRVVTIQVMPYDYSDRLVAQLQAELWMTVK